MTRAAHRPGLAPALRLAIAALSAAAASSWMCAASAQPDAAESAVTSKSARGDAALTHGRGQASKRVTIEVIEIAGRRGYVAPGASAGLRLGDTVVFAGRRHPVLATSRETSLIGLGPGKLRVGQRGAATIPPDRTGAPAPRPTPAPLAAFAGRWPEAPRPARTQRPDPVPLGSPLRHRRATRLAVSAAAVGRVPLDRRAEPLAFGRLRARVHSEPLAPVPLALDADLAAQLWLAADLAQRAGQRARPPARVYMLAARYGEPDAWQAAVGRLRHAATGLGSLDGVRTQAPLLETLTLGAFGGLMPNPLSGALDATTARFGAELVYDDPRAPMRPRVSVTAHGSRFQGELDERRIFVQADAYPGDGYVGGYALASLFDRDNPWNAPATELTAAGAHTGLRTGPFHAGLRLDLQRPERSLWLASLLPPEWLCIARRAPPVGPPERCHGDEARLLLQAETGLQVLPFAVNVGATWSHTTHVDAAQQAGFIHARFAPEGARARLDATVTGSTGSLLRSMSLTLATALAFGETSELSLRYRPAISQYVAARDAFVEHTVGGSLSLHPAGDLDVSLTADATHGRDVRLLMLQLITTWWR